MIPESLPACSSLPSVEPHGTTRASASIVVDESNVYSAAGRGVTVIPKSGAAPWALVSDTIARAIAEDDTNIYFAGDQLWSVPKTGGAVRVLFDQPTDGIAVSDDSVFFCDYPLGTRPKLRRWSEPTGVEEVATFTDASSCGRLVVQDRNVYRIPLATPWARASRVRIADGAEDLIADNIQVSRGFAVAGPFLYFSEADSQSIQRLSLADGTRSTLFSFAGDPSAIDTDGSLLYVIVQYLDAVTKHYTPALLRMTVEGSDPCVVGSAAFDASLVVSGDRAYWTGDCLIHGAR
ncbi:MAG TPA: hypothetical protein VFK05_27205 [Polyangiaceae bacterium]|nr:hypothetical protein [Polyangiaceae bacterium]